MQMRNTAGGKYNHSSAWASQAEAEQQLAGQQSGGPPVPGIRLENTYQMGPTAGGQFPLGRAGRILREVLRDYLAGEKYEEEFARSISQSISQALRARMKELQSGSGRYKIIALCSVGAQGPHGLSLASRCLWDEAVDNYVTSQFDNSSLYAVATVFAIYQE